MILRKTLILALAVTSSFLVNAGEVTVQTWNYTSQAKDYGVWYNSMRGAGWEFGTLGAYGSKKDGREQSFVFRGSNDIFDCMYRESKDETQCGTHIWNENNALFRVSGNCDIKKTSGSIFVLTCKQ